MRESFSVKKFQKKGAEALAKCALGCYIMSNGCGSPEPVAAVAPHRGGSLNIFDDFFESVGRCVCTGVTTGTSSTPAGSFFVPDVEVGGKSHKLTSRRLKWNNKVSPSDTDNPISPPARFTPALPLQWSRRSNRTPSVPSALPPNAWQTKRHFSATLTACLSRRSCGTRSDTSSPLNTTATAVNNSCYSTSYL